MTTQTPRRPSNGGSNEPEKAPETAMAVFAQRLRSPLAPYYLLIVAIGLLVLLGLAMVLSASAIRSYREAGSSYATFSNQLMFAVVGVVLAAVASRLPIRIWKMLAWPGIILSVGLLAMVIFSGAGMAEGGNQNWVGIAGLTIQPSEFAKLAVIVFGATVLANKRRVIGSVVQMLVPFLVPGTAAVFGLIMLGHDLGTGLIVLAIAGGMLFCAGVQARWFVLLGGAALAGVTYLAMDGAARTDRIDAWLGDLCTGPDMPTVCDQKVHGLWALAGGGVWGLGLGESRAKWSHLPEPHNDFIFAVIGEELGLPGTLSVLLLFMVIAYASYRIVAESTDFFVRLASAGVMVWFLSQTMINIGSVTAMLPIIGVPLPFVSAGGSALIACLLGAGLLLAMARNLPGAKEALAARPSMTSRAVAMLPIPDRFRMPERLTAGRRKFTSAKSASGKSTRASTTPRRSQANGGAKANGASKASGRSQAKRRSKATRGDRDTP